MSNVIEQIAVASELRHRDGRNVVAERIYEQVVMPLEKRLTESERYGRQADITIENLERRVEQLTSKGRELAAEAALVYGKYNETQMPDRDLVDMQTLHEMHELCSGMNIIDVLPDKLLTLAAEKAVLKAAIKEIVDSAEEAEYDGYFSFVVNPDAIHAGADLIESETTATDAILAEVRAQGVEQLASLAGNECQRYKSVGDRAGVRKWKSIVILCTDFAAQLRQEAK